MIKNLISACAVILFISSCEKEPEKPTPSTVSSFSNGVFILNEGAFGAGNSGITFYSKNENSLIPDLYQQANNLPLGDVLQSMTVVGNSAYLCVNNSQKIEIVSMRDFKKTGSITGIGSPRFLVASQNKGYVSDWITNSVYKIDLLTQTIIDTIACGSGPEEMLIKGNKLFVCNSGGFGDDSSMSVIDLNTFTIDTVLSVGVNPSHIREDANGKVWILCRGSLGSDFTPSPDDAGGRLIQLDPVSLTQEKNFAFGYNEHPIRLTVTGDKNTLIFLNGETTYTGNVWRMSTNASSLPASPFIDRIFYGLGVDPVDGTIYGGKVSFTSNTQVLRYNSNGALLDSLECGIGPNGFVFN